MLLSLLPFRLYTAFCTTDTPKGRLQACVHDALLRCLRAVSVQLAPTPMGRPVGQSTAFSCNYATQRGHAGDSPQYCADGIVSSLRTPDSYSPALSVGSTVSATRGSRRDTSHFSIERASHGTAGQCFTQLGPPRSLPEPECTSGCSRRYGSKHRARQSHQLPPTAHGASIEPAPQPPSAVCDTSQTSALAVPGRRSTKQPGVATKSGIDVTAC